MKSKPWTNNRKESEWTITMALPMAARSFYFLFLLFFRWFFFLFSFFRCQSAHTFSNPNANKQHPTHKMIAAYCKLKTIFPSTNSIWRMKNWNVVEILLDYSLLINDSLFHVVSTTLSIMCFYYNWLNNDQKMPLKVYESNNSNSSSKKVKRKYSQTH